MSDQRCTWCGRDVEADGGYRVADRPGDRGAVFCRLEHVVAWAIKGPHWEAGEPRDLAPPTELAAELETCSHCGQRLGDTRVLLVRHRVEHRIWDGFCSVDHLREWAKAGGRWGK